MYGYVHCIREYMNAWIGLMCIWMGVYGFMCVYGTDVCVCGTEAYMDVQYRGVYGYMYCIDVYMDVHIYIYIYVYCLCIYIYIACIYGIDLYIDTCMVLMGIWMCIYMYTYSLIPLHLSASPYIHTNTSTYTQIHQGQWERRIK